MSEEIDWKERACEMQESYDLMDASWSRIVDERNEAQDLLAAERARVGTLEKANEMLEEDRKREKSRAEKAEGDRDFWRQRYDAAAKLSGEIESDLAVARREIKDSRSVIWMLVTQAGGEVVIGGSVILRLDEVRARIETSRDPGGDLRIRAALAARTEVLP